MVLQLPAFRPRLHQMATGSLGFAINLCQKVICVRVTGREGGRADEFVYENKLRGGFAAFLSPSHHSPPAPCLRI
jgi:hypothetical protein